MTIVAHDVEPTGGMERQLTRLATGLLERGHPVTVVAMTCRLAAHPLLRFVRVPGPRRPFALRYPWFFTAASLALWRTRRGAVHTTGAIVFNRAHVSTVHFCHAAFGARGGERGSRRSAAYRLNAWASAVMSRLAERYSYSPRRTRALVAVSEGVAGELREHFPALARATRVIHNGVDLEEFGPDAASRRDVRQRLEIGDDELVAVFVGGEWGRKGLQVALDALARAPAWRLLVVGPGDEDEYSRSAESLGVSERVRFVGAVDKPAPYYAAADVFLLPTLYETFSLVTFEAAACGLPLLVTPVSGVEELIVDGENGWLIDRDPVGIAERLRQLEDAALRARLGSAARASAAEYGWDAMVDGYERLYEELSAL